MKGNLMKSAKSALPILLAMLFGAALGAFLTRPPKVHAVGGIHVQKVTGEFTMAVGSEYLGFACTQEDCYIASR
jgi:hypothetical protein